MRSMPGHGLILLLQTIAQDSHRPFSKTWQRMAACRQLIACTAALDIAMCCAVLLYRCLYKSAFRVC